MYVPTLLHCLTCLLPSVCGYLSLYCSWSRLWGTLSAHVVIPVGQWVLPLDGLYGHLRSSPSLHAALPLLWPAPDRPGRHLSRLARRQRSVVQRPGSNQSHVSRLDRRRLVLLVEPIWKQNSYSKRRFHLHRIDRPLHFSYTNPTRLTPSGLSL